VYSSYMYFTIMHNEQLELFCFSRVEPCCVFKTVIKCFQLVVVFFEHWCLRVSCALLIRGVRCELKGDTFCDIWQKLLAFECTDLKRWMLFRWCPSNPGERKSKRNQQKWGEIDALMLKVLMPLLPIDLCCYCAYIQMWELSPSHPILV